MLDVSYMITVTITEKKDNASKNQPQQTIQGGVPLLSQSSWITIICNHQGAVKHNQKHSKHFKGNMLMSLLSKKEFSLEAIAATDVISAGQSCDFAIRIDNSKCG